MMLPLFIRLIAAACLATAANGIAIRLPTSSGTSGSTGGGSTNFFLPQFFAPQMTPAEFLLVSSSSEAKVVYTELKNFKSTTGRTWALVDSGLVEPKSIAFDRQRGYLFIADKGANKIFRYHVIAKPDAGGGLNKYTLATDGMQLTVKNVAGVEWVSVDVNGALFYADPGTQAIVKIPAETIEAMGDGMFTAGDLKTVSQTQLEANLFQQAQLALTTVDNSASSAMPTDPPGTTPEVFNMYEGNKTTHISTPGGVVSDGVRLYWVNTQNGTAKGTVVMGEADPLPRLGANTTPPTLPASAITNATATAYGIAKSSTMVFYSTNITGSGTVYGVGDGGDVTAFAQGLIEPRGLVWDGDQTVFVADQAGNSVWSFPVGRLVEDAPLTQSVALNGAFGVALFSVNDAAFQSKAAARIDVLTPLMLACVAAWVGGFVAK